MRRALVIIVLAFVGCARAPEAPAEAPVTARTGTGATAAVPWSYAIVSDAASGEFLYAVVIYGRNALADAQPKRSAVPLDGVLVSIPPAEGALYVLDSSLVCHKAPLTAAEVKHLVQQERAGTLRTAAIWKKLQPFLQTYKASD